MFVNLHHLPEAHSRRVDRQFVHGYQSITDRHPKIIGLARFLIDQG